MAETEKHIKTRIIHKHDLEINWDKAINFIPKQGELIIYDIEVDEEGNTLKTTNDAGVEVDALPEGRTTPYTYERFKIGDGIHNPHDLHFTHTDIVDNVSIVCDENGFISLPKKYVDYLDNQLYQAPAISAFDFFSAGTAEIGTTISVTQFTHKETNVDSIKGKLTLKEKEGNTNTVLMSDITASDSTKTETFSKKYTSSTPGTVTVTLSGINTKNVAFSKTDSIAFYAPHYYGAKNPDNYSIVEGSDIKSLGLTKHSSTSSTWTGTISIPNGDNESVYFITTDNALTVKSGGFDVPLEKTMIDITVNEVPTYYYCYRTNQLAADTLTYVLS